MMKSKPNFMSNLYGKGEHKLLHITKVAALFTWLKLSKIIRSKSDDLKTWHEEIGDSSPTKFICK